MKKTFALILVSTVFFLLSCKVQVDQKLPEDAVVLDQIIYVDEVRQGVPQTIQLPNGTVVTYKMPEKLYDGQLIKVKHIEGERPYYIKISLRNRDGSDKK